MATSAERQRAFRARKKQEGLVQVTGLVPRKAQADLMIIMQMLRDNPDLEIAVQCLRDTVSGRFVRI